MASDGVIQFKPYHRLAPAPSFEASFTSGLLRDALHARRWIGRNPNRYGGLGYGNASARTHGGRFVVSATQTGHLQSLADHNWVLVSRASPETNELWSEGPSMPSSEALTHAAIYGDSSACFVVHIHHPALWRAALAGEVALAKTPLEAAYGTPAMAAALSAISREATLPFAAVMTGHEDGIMAAGADAESLVALLSKLTEAAIRAR